MADLLRTTSFRVAPKALGKVCAYKAGARFMAAWQRLDDARNDKWQLRYASLAISLRVMSADFVRINVRPKPESDPFFIVSRKPLALNSLREAMMAWEAVVSPQTGGRLLADAVDDLRSEDVPLSNCIRTRKGQCPVVPPWIFDAGKWEISYRLASKSFQIDDGTLNLSIDTEGDLLTWDRVICGGKNQDFFAMHRITPRLITVPGVEDVVVHLDGALSRLTNKWNGVKSAWVKRPDGDGLILAFSVRHGPAPEYKPFWTDQSAAVLKRTWHGDFPDADEVDLKLRKDHVRATVSRAFERWPIGKGPGQVFHSYVASHAKDVLHDCQPLEFEKAMRQLERRNQVVQGPEDVVAAAREAGRGRVPRFLCLYAMPETRRRMLTGLASIFGDELTKNGAKDGEVISAHGVEIVIRSPKGSVDTLTQPGNPDAIRSWAKAVFEQDAASGAHILGAFVETKQVEELKSSNEFDPKFILRRLFAEREIATQFLTEASAPDSGDEDHPARAAAFDLMRSSGVFPSPFPGPSGNVDGTIWLVGVYVVRLSNQRAKQFANGRTNGGERFVVSIVAAEAGGRKAMGFSDAGWVPLAQATTKFFVGEPLKSYAEVPTWTETALQQLLVRDHNCKVIAFMEHAGCAKFWNGLTDKGEGQLPASASNSRVAVIRTRVNPQHVPRPAGTGPWIDPALPAGRAGVMDALVTLKSASWDGARFYVSTPRLMGAMGPHRQHTRFTADPRTLRNDWHALNMTEFSCRHQGPFIPAGLYELSALLCRQAPTWDGTLNWPSPLHLAKAIVADHPGRYLDGENDPESGG